MAGKKPKFKFREIDPYYYRIINNYEAIKLIWLSVFSTADRNGFQNNLDKAVESNKDGLIGIYRQKRNLSIDQAVLELSKQIGQMQELEYKLLLKRIRAKPAAAPRIRIPSWDKQNGILSVGKKVLRKVKRLNQAKNAVAILDAFEELEWPSRIDDPIPGGNSRKLNDAVKSLNDKLIGMIFRTDGTGQGITWSFKRP